MLDPWVGGLAIAVLLSRWTPCLPVLCCAAESCQACFPAAQQLLLSVVTLSRCLGDLLLHSLVARCVTQWWFSSTILVLGWSLYTLLL